MSGLEVLIEWLEENPYEKRLNILRKAKEINELAKKEQDLRMSEHHHHAIHGAEYTVNKGYFDYPFTVDDFNYYTNCTR